MAWDACGFPIGRANVLAVRLRGDLMPANSFSEYAPESNLETQPLQRPLPVAMLKMVARSDRVAA
jgi:hypothetical protein